MDFFSELSSGLGQLHFLRPYFLLLIPLGLFIAWYFSKVASQKDSWEQICDPHLLSAIKTSEAQKGSQWNLWLYPILIIAGLALSGPAFRLSETPLIKSQSALIIALDVSKSMLAEDIKPNRLERAKFKINDILDQRKEGQTALIVYSGDAFVVTPLSDDVDTIKLMLKALSPQIMPLQGSREDRALEKAQQLLQQANLLTGNVLLVTDEVKLSNSETIVKALAAENIFTSVLAIGTEQGAMIPDDYGFVKNSQGQIITAALDIEKMVELAKLGKGRFAMISGSNQDIDSLQLNSIEDNSANTLESENSEQEKFIDDGPFLVLLMIPLVLLLMRKGLLLSFFLVISIHTPQPTMAFEWSDLWLNADQKAAKGIKNSEYDKAFSEAKSDKWKASAAYKQKQYKNASELFNGNTADDFYNKANALAKMGELESALENYDKSLAIRPDDEDTIYNRKLVEEALKQQQEQEQQNQQNSDSEENQEDSENQQGQSDDQQEQNSESQNSESEQQQDGNQSEENSEDNPENSNEATEQEQQELTEEEKRKLQQEQEALEKADQEAEQQEQQKQLELTPEELADDAEKKEAMEQWLRRIPDDPGGLLRRKFYYQYSKQNDKPNESEDW